MLNNHEVVIEQLYNGMAIEIKPEWPIFLDYVYLHKYIIFIFIFLCIICLGSFTSLELTAVHRVAQSWTWLKWLSICACLGEGMATHSSIIAWRIPWTEEPGGLPSMGSHRVGHNWSDLAAVAAELTQTCSLIWLRNIPLHICTTASLTIHLLMRI